MSDFQSTVVNIARNVTKASGDLLKSTKLNMSLSSEEANLKSLYMEIGRKVHEIYSYGGSLGEYFDGKYMEIVECERKISDIKEQIGKIKGIRECPKCGKKVERVSEFCPKCGLKLGVAEAEIPAAAPVTSPVEPAEFFDAQRMPHSHDATSAPPVPPAPVPPGPSPWESTPPPAPAPLPLPEKICRICGSKNETTTKFCLSCGRILD
ncbi:MAG: zinc ribbon domain-containing protein [Defluviitaleaceae bacterium]|nr:zinc ribbon domain-containing protein [Defluviitaleaceae bacterium]